MKKGETKIRFETAKDMELVRKAAKAQKRSMNQYMAIACVEAAKTTLLTKIPPSQSSAPEATA